MTSALAQPAVSPLGTIRLASFVTNGSGSGKGKLRRYPSYALVNLLDGLGYYRDSTGFTQPVHPGDLIWVSPRVAHTYGPQEGHFWNEFFVVFDGPIFELLESKKMFDVLPPVQHLEAAHLWMERLAKVCQTSTRTANSATAAIIDLQSILLDLIALQTKSREPAEEWLISAAHIIEQLSPPNEGLTRIAKRFGLSYETFRKKFTRRFGVSPQRYRMRHLMQKAIVLLNEENLSVKETASRLGFCDEFYFSRAFRKLTGRPPSSLRKKVLPGVNSDRLQLR
jgi:AraC family transcriptional regulator, arabinose operon regulatory protein